MNVVGAVLQYDCPESVELSIVKLEEMVARAKKNGAQLVVAPETSIGMLADVSMTGTDYLPFICSISKKYEVFLATSFYRKANDGNIYNQGYLINQKGNPILEQKKLYLAPPEQEVKKISSGREVSIVETEIGTIGMLICKDGFTKYSHHIYEKYNQLGVDIICAPTWSIGWKNSVCVDVYVQTFYTYGSLLSRSYILLSGNLNKSTESFGESLIISPVKGILQKASRINEEILVQSLDLSEVTRMREFDNRWQPDKRVI